MKTAQHFEWYNNPGTASSSTVNKYYNTEEECWMSTGWFKTVPSEDVDPEATTMMRPTGSTQSQTAAW